MIVIISLRVEESQILLTIFCELTSICVQENFARIVKALIAANQAFTVPCNCLILSTYYAWS